MRTVEQSPALFGPFLETKATGKRALRLLTSAQKRDEANEL